MTSEYTYGSLTGMRIAQAECGRRKGGGGWARGLGAEAGARAGSRAPYSGLAPSDSAIISPSPRPERLSVPLVEFRHSPPFIPPFRTFLLTMATPHVIASSSAHHGSQSGTSNGIVGAHFRVGKKIGEGSFGVVFEGMLRSPGAT